MNTLIPALGAAFFAGIAVGLIILMIRRAAMQREYGELRIRLAELEQARHSETEKLDWVEKAEVQLRDAFEALAGKALRNNASELTRQAKGELEHLVQPLTKNLTDLDQHIRSLETKREGAYGALGQQLKQLQEMQLRLQTSTTTLAQALRSPTVRGRWGEMQLKRIVEMAGMTDHVDFEEQTSGETGRPDMIVRLPNGGILPIDSKTPFDSYLNAMEATDPSIRNSQLEAHAKAMRARIRELGQKSYWTQFKRSPDFVIMFIPNEACLGAAFEHDPQLLEFALSNRILMSSPVNLLALLRTVAYGWQQHTVAENAEKIAAEGKELHRRLMTFLGHVTKIGKHLDQSVSVYNAAIRSFEKRILPSARRFEEFCAMEQSVPELDQIAETSVETVLSFDELSEESEPTQDAQTEFNLTD